VPSWVAAGRVRKIWFGQGLAAVVKAAAHKEAQELAGVGALRVEGEDWVLELAPARLRSDVGEEGEFWLGLFDPVRLLYDELECKREGNLLRAEGAVARAERLAVAGDAPEWTLEQRVNEVTVARSRRE